MQFQGLHEDLIYKFRELQHIVLSHLSVKCTESLEGQKEMMDGTEDEWQARK